MVKLSSERSDRPCKALSFSHSGKFLATAQDGPQAQSSGNDEKIEVASLLCIYLHCFADEMLEALCMCLHSRLGESSPAQVLDGSADLLRKIWRMSGVEVLEKKAVQQGHVGRINSLAWSRNDQLISTGGSDGLVIVWAFEMNGEEVQLVEAMSLVGHQASVSSVAFSKSGNCLASASWDLTVRLWDLTFGSLLGILAGHEDLVSDLAFSSDGNTLATAGRDERSVRLWGVHSGREKASVKFQGLPKGSARSVAFSDDKNLIAIGCSDWMVRLYDAKTGLPPKWGGVLSSHWGIVTCLAFTLDGTCLASGSDDGSVRLWDTKTGKHVGEAMQHGCLIGALALCGNHLAASSGDLWTVWGEVTVWELRGKADRAESTTRTIEISGANAARAVGNWKLVRAWKQPERPDEVEREKEEKEKRLLQDDVRAYYAWLDRSGGANPVL